MTHGEGKWGQMDTVTFLQEALQVLPQLVPKS